MHKILLRGDKYWRTKLYKHKKISYKNQVKSVLDEVDSWTKLQPESRSSNGLNLLSTSLLCKHLSSKIIDRAFLQISSSLNASVHLPSWTCLVFNFPWTASYLLELERGKDDERMFRCNHILYLSSILGCNVRRDKGEEN